jgi:uncharacterized membrane protein YidH (DUF202 family)
MHHTKEQSMTGLRTAGMAIIIAGILALAYGGFSYTKDSTALKVGPVELSVKQKETVNIPIWAGLGAIVVGALVLVGAGRKG